MSDERLEALEELRSTDRKSVTEGFDPAEFQAREAPTANRKYDSPLPLPDLELTTSDTASLSDKLDKAVDAINSGDLRAVKRVLIDAFEQSTSSSDFATSVRNLKVALEPHHVTVRFADGKEFNNALSIHREGNPQAIQFSLDRGSESGKAILRSQVYDWVTKENIDSSNVSESFKNLMSAKLDTGLRDSAELGAEFDSAAEREDFDSVLKHFAASAEWAHALGGIDALRKLEARINKSTQSAGSGPIVIEENGKLNVYAATELSISERERAENLSPEELAKQRMVRHPRFGLLKITAKGPGIQSGK